MPATSPGTDPVTKGNRYALIGIWLTAIGLVVGTAISLIAIYLDKNKDTPVVVAGSPVVTQSSATPQPKASEPAWTKIQEKVSWPLGIPLPPEAGGCDVFAIDFDKDVDGGWEAVTLTQQQAAEDVTYDLYWSYCHEQGVLSISGDAGARWSQGGKMSTRNAADCAARAAANEQVAWRIGDGVANEPEGGETICLLTRSATLVRIQFISITSTTLTVISTAWRQEPG